MVVGAKTDLGITKEPKKLPSTFSDEGVDGEVNSLVDASAFNSLSKQQTFSRFDLKQTINESQKPQYYFSG
jgi:hypothetical protein